MKASFRIITVFNIAFAVSLAFAADPIVSNVAAKQRCPWNGLVDITCQVTGIESTTKTVEFAVAVVNQDFGDVKKASRFWVVRDGVKSTDRKVRSDGDYHLLWDARADLGLGLFSNIVVRVTAVDVHDKVQLWEGGPFWATTNIGAEEPWESGYYFWWGDTVGYKRANNSWVASDGSASGFLFSLGNTPTSYKNISTLKNEGWIDANNTLLPEHDAAHVQLGGVWRMPTLGELDGLNSNCDWTWTTQNGVGGYLVRGRGDYASASIFLPCAGYGNGASLSNAGSDGYYWSSVPNSGSSYDSCYLYFSSSYHFTYNICDRITGQPVRPVQGFTK